jgi:predicted nucleotidyltransferase
MRADSDVDLLVVTTRAAAEDELVRALARLERALGREVNYRLYRDADFERRRGDKDPFLAEVLSGGRIMLKGGL